MPIYENTSTKHILCCRR